MAELDGWNESFPFTPTSLRAAPLDQAGHCFEWADIKQDLNSLQGIAIEEQGKSLVVRSECKGICGKVFQSVGVAVPPTIREL